MMRLASDHEDWIIQKCKAPKQETRPRTYSNSYKHDPAGITIISSNWREKRKGKE